MADIVPSERELEILKVLWELGTGSVREVHERLCPGGELAFNTIQTLLRIMEEKGLVGHEQVGRIFIYKPYYSRQRVAARFLDKVFDGALVELVLTLLRNKDATADELQSLERLIAKARREKAVKARKGE